MAKKGSCKEERVLEEKVGRKRSCNAVGLVDGLYCVSNMRGSKKYIWLCRAVSLYLRPEERRRFQCHDSMSNENKRKNLKQS